MTALPNGGYVTSFVNNASNPAEEGIYFVSPSGALTQLVSATADTASPRRAADGTVFIDANPGSYRVENGGNRATLVNVFSNGEKTVHAEGMSVEFNVGNLRALYYTSTNETELVTAIPSASFSDRIPGCWNGVEFVAYDSGNHALTVTKDGVKYVQIQLPGSAEADPVYCISIPD